MMGSGARIAVALSGGVDSAVAAALLIEQGYEVTAYHMRIVADPDPESQEHALSVAQTLGVPFRAVDLRQDFQSSVVDYFVRSYQQGLTPNPCVVCNRIIKFGRLMDIAFEEGAQGFATGHYVQVLTHLEYGRLLHRAVYAKKDQTYFLAQLSRDRLDHMRFPNGPFTKEEIRLKARRSGLPVHDKKESQEICFITGDYRDYLRMQGVLSHPGPIKDSQGALMGQHKGLFEYTLGQRKGLGIASSEPLYVIGMDFASNTLIVGDHEQTTSQSFSVDRLNWMTDTHHLEQVCACKVRSGMKPVRCSISIDRETQTATVTMKSPVSAITPGQLAAFYDEGFLLGSGFISMILP